MSLRCFTLRTGHGTKILASPLRTAGVVTLAARAAAQGEAEVVLGLASANRHAGWLIAPGHPRIAIEGEENPGIAVPVKLDRAGVENQVRLLHSLHRWCNLGLHGALQQAEGELSFSHKGPHKEQQFWLDPVEPPADIAGAFAELDSTMNTPPRWQTVLACLRGGNLRAALTDAALRSLPADELEGLARHLLTCSEDLLLLGTAVPDNLWWTQRLPALVAWRTARDAKRPPGTLVTVGTSDDMPGTNGKPPPPLTLGLVLSGFARAATPPGRMACVLVTARDEGAYLLEWIAYHLSVGFEHFFFYTDDNSDGSDTLLQHLAEAGVITWFRNEVRPESLPQHRAYGHALSVMPEILDYRWTLVADIDEYIGFDTAQFATVIDYINWQEQRYAEAIALPWLIHIARPADSWSEKPCIERFPLRDSAINSFVKMLFRTNHAWNANPHYPEPIYGRGINYKSEAGEPHMAQGTPAQTAKPSAEKAWIAHYMFRSAPELMMKLARGRADQPVAVQTTAAENRIKTFLAQLQTTRLVEDRRTLLCGRNQQQALAALLRLPGVAACDGALKRSYAENMRKTCDLFVNGADSAGPGYMAALRNVLVQALR